jgi:hypothetical protein
LLRVPFLRPLAFYLFYTPRYKPGAMEDSDERIRFSLRGPEGVYGGEIRGDGLRDNAVFEVELSTGERFAVKAQPDQNAEGFVWEPTADQFRNLAQVIGNVIERYFRRKNKRGLSNYNEL